MNTIKKRIGIMGGTFDPVHNAHLKLAEKAYQQFGLHAIWMLPNGNPPHKKDITQADVHHRIRMIQMAIQEIPYLKLCDLELTKRGYHYTYETLQQLHDDHPNTRFYFIMGADSLFDFDDWREPGIISRECVILAAARDRCKRARIEERVTELEGRYGADIRILEMPNMDIASSEIRRRIACGKGISDMVPFSVADYIFRHGLYENVQEDTEDGCN